MDEITRRRLLKASTALGIAGSIPQGIETAVAQTSPSLEKYVQPLPIPTVRKPEGKRRGADYHKVSVTEFTQSLHPDLPDTTLWGFDGTFPGPIIEGRRNKRLKVRFDNSQLPTEHLLSVDEQIHGTKPEDYPNYDGPVPEVRTVTHFHGLNIEPESDGQAEMWKSPGEITGPRFVKQIHDIPNRQSKLTSTYHDHALGISRLNVYAGLAGFYLIRSRAEEKLDLPSGEYEIPLMLQDRTFNEDGSLYYPKSFVPNFAGDTAVVNGSVWPYLEVEPRRYRFRCINQSNGRTFNLRLSNESGTNVPTLYQTGAGHGFFESTVPIGASHDLDSLLLSPFERADIVVDFSEYAGETFTVTNDAEFPFEGKTEGSDLGELLQIRVLDSAKGQSDSSADPTNLDLPGGSKVNEQAAKKIRHMTMNMIRDEHGLALHLLNNSRFHDETIVKPQLGTTEIWELENKTHHTHPIHLHLVEFSVIGRGPNGTDDPAPNERIGKDVVRVNPDETVRILVRFGNFAGQFPWHCHILEHEDHAMMRPFEVVTGNAAKNRGQKNNNQGEFQSR
ncbi:spore coat protein A [Haladaptatus litoreus]|uniref:Multicopper oxidase CueO n=1 Tax=Haladaptatus litoreus TaxID=553468 RepID=A0A1N7EHN9_9EURY|nr:multicopper oxidase [Haladaptatus litoreus]SIR87564.1 spore coat protein A [Haladaptatus litoreus]